MKKILLIILCLLIGFFSKADIPALDACGVNKWVVTGGFASNHRFVTVRYDASVAGNDIYISVPSGGGFSGPYTPITKTFVNGVWLYTYDLGVIPSACVSIYPRTDLSLPASIYDQHISACICDFDIIEACGKDIFVSSPGGIGSTHRLVTVTYNQNVAGTDIFMYRQDGMGGFFGPYAPLTITFSNGVWIYTYDIGLVPSSCVSLYPRFDQTEPSSTNDYHYSACLCQPELIDACGKDTLIARDGIASTHRFMTVTYAQGISGTDVYLSYPDGLGGFAGPIPPLTKTFSNGVWVYTYDLGLILSSCIDIYPTLDQAVPSSLTATHYNTCICDPQIMYGCVREYWVTDGEISGLHKFATVMFDQSISGADVYIWSSGILGLSGPYAPISKILINGVWIYIYDIGMSASSCVNVYAGMDPNVTPAVSDPHKYICRCEDKCDASFTYCGNSVNPYEISFYPNTSLPFVSYDFGDGTSCINCTLPITHTYSADGVYYVCQTTWFIPYTKCRTCTQICITTKKK